MEFGGRYHVAAPRLNVWQALNTAGVLKACIPGCQRLEWAGPDSLELDIKVNLGVVKPVFSGELTLSQIVPAESYTLSGRGKGGILGLAHGSADIVLADDGEDTILHFVAHGSASARIMQFGQVLIGDRAQKIIDGFFVHFGEVMGATVTPLEL